MNLWHIYHQSVPDFVREIAETLAMRRLQDVGMNCGCEYTAFPLFTDLEKNSRFDHSVGCGLIVWHFTRDTRQTVAALLHDIASPVFAHVIDFLNGDHERQESTEDATAEIIAQSPELMRILASLGLSLDEVSDYHLYSVADNDTPRLSADRLEYTLGNVVNYRLAPRETVRNWYDNLMVAPNEEGTDEMMFTDLAVAEAFGHAALQMSRVYVSDEDRYAMQMLAELLKRHINRGILTMDDLYKTENEVITILENDAVAHAEWQDFRSLHRVDKEAGHPNSRVVPAKKRYINPMVRGKGRLADLSPAFAADMADFLSLSFAEALCGH